MSRRGIMTSRRDIISKAKKVLQKIGWCDQIYCYSSNNAKQQPVGNLLKITDILEFLGRGTEKAFAIEEGRSQSKKNAGKEINLLYLKYFQNFLQNLMFGKNTNLMLNILKYLSTPIFERR